MTKLVRYFELTAKLAEISEPVFTEVCQKSINQVLDKFFDFDTLTQMTLMDFFQQFKDIEWASTLVAPFLAKLFKAFRDD